MALQQDFISLLSTEFERLRARNASYSLRAFARKLDLPPSALSDLFNGKRRVTFSMAVRIMDRLETPPDQRQTLLQDYQAPSRMRVPDANGSLPDRSLHLVSMDHFHFISKWFYFAVHTLAETQDFEPEPEWIANRLNISRQDARLALERLERLGLLVRDKNKVLKSAGIKIRTTTDLTSAALRKAHHENLDLAHRSLDEDSVDERDFTSITVATSARRMTEAKRQIKNFRRRIWKYLDEGPKEDVYQLQIQFFPLTKSREPQAVGDSK